MTAAMPDTSDARPIPQVRRATQTSDLRSELDAYQQHRLRMVTAFLGWVGLVLLLVGRVADVLQHGWVLENQVHPSVVTHTAALGVAFALHRVLSTRRLNSRGLLVVDAIVVGGVSAASILVFVFSYRTGIRQLVPLVGLLLVARAVAVPSRWVRTFWISLPIVLALPLVEVAHGAVYTLDGIAWPAAGFAAYVVWDFVILATALTLAALTSRVLYGLRMRLHEAARVDRYTLEHLVGRGAMGEVYRARHAMLRRPVALKMLRAEITSEHNLERFEKEVQRTSLLTHPNTVRVFDYGVTAEGALYYAMEFLEGADLERILEVGGPLPASRVIHVLAQTCGALEEAHAAGLVHGDLKPANLMLCVQGQRHDVVKVLDFGLARRMVQDPAEGVPVVTGTPLTMAPEVIRGQAIGPGTDLYALGAVGCHLLTGRTLFEHESAGAYVRAHLFEAPVPPSHRVEGVPPGLEALLLACLAKDVEARPPSAGVVRTQLLALAEDHPWTPQDAAAWWQAHGADLHLDANEADAR